MSEATTETTARVQTYRRGEADDDSAIVGATAHGCRAEVRVSSEIAVYAQGVISPGTAGVRLVADGRTIAENYRRNDG